MKTVSPAIQNLIDKLKLAEEIYKRSSTRIHNHPMREQFQSLADDKHRFLIELSDLLKLDLDKHQINMMDRIELEWEKAEIEVNHILIHRNENDILGYCIKREEELVNVYKEILSKNNQNDFLLALLNSQLSDTERILNELIETKKAYEFENNG